MRTVNPRLAEICPTCRVIHATRAIARRVDDATWTALLEEKARSLESLHHSVLTDVAPEIVAACAAAVAQDANLVLVCHTVDYTDTMFDAFVDALDADTLAGFDAGHAAASAQVPAAPTSVAIPTPRGGAQA